MALSLNIHKLTDAYMNGESASEELRRGGRMPMVGVKSNLGPVLDLSFCGVLIRRSWWRSTLRQKQRLIVVIKFDGVRVAVKARVARKAKKRGIGWVYGLEFTNVSPEQRDKIMHVARSCYPKQTMHSHNVA
ncbi:MAG: PilZ domain-containing protein [Phycisphaerales bacterium JB063]